LKPVKTCYDAPVRGGNFKAWNGFRDLLIKISSEVIAAYGTRPE
jgi:hypothetical protein